MTKDKEEFLKELLNDFKIEASEHLQSIVNGLLDLEKDLHNPARPGIIETAFRNTHSMKGAARAVNLMQFERLCMSLESVFHEIKKGNLELAKPMFDVFFQATDLLDVMLKEIGSQHKTVSENAVSQLDRKLKSLSGKNFTLSELPVFPAPALPVTHEEEKTAPLPVAVQTSGALKAELPTDKVQTEKEAPEKHKTTNTEKSTEKETVRVSTSKLYDMLRFAEEMISIKSELQFHTAQLQQIANQIGSWKRKYEDRLAHNIGSKSALSPEENGMEKELLKRYESDLIHLGKNLDQLYRASGRSVDDLILSIKKTLMQPFSSMLMVVPKIVRDLSKEYNKEIKFDVQGAETEIDRRILEEMKDPFIHLIRNCIDHGIETRDARIGKNKPPAGSLAIAIYNDSDQKVKITISDDGAGIQQDKLLAAAIRSGIVKAGEVKTMSEKEINMLIFASGVSTSPFITDVSGRGLGMAIVAEKIATVGGSIDLESIPGKGTTFHITLPQTLATFRGILVKASGSLFLIPTAAVIKAVKIVPSDITTVESKNTLRIENENPGIVSLADVLGMRRRHTGKNAGSLQALILQHAQKKMVFVVEEVLGEHEGVVKSLGPQLRQVNNIAGAILLGNGRIVPVLNIPQLLVSASGKNYVEAEPGTQSQNKDDTAQTRQILVAEDSITVRNMLRNYLETAGFTVKTAIDGQDAYEQLQTGNFDIVVSDVEMPRMNGFELTARIRKNVNFGQLPVILVTALESTDDRRRGMDAGANAYIVKSSFEKSNLIDTINRLI